MLEAPLLLLDEIDPERAADDRLDALVPHGLGEFERTEQVAGVGDRHRRHPGVLRQTGERLDLKGALEAGRRRPEPVLVRAEVKTAGPSLPLEVLFLPLAAAPGSPERFLGLYQPLGMVARLQGLPALEIAVEKVINMGPANQESPRLRLAALDGRRIA